MSAIATSRFPAVRLGSVVAALALAAVAYAGPAQGEAFAALATYTGAPQAPVEARDLNGAPIKIGPDKTRVTLVHFFASWCEPCERELPDLLEFVRARDGRVALIGVAVAEPASRARKFVAKFGIPGAVAHDEDQSVVRAFGVRGLPATIALAPQGTTAAAAFGALDWKAGATADALIALAAQDNNKNERSGGVNQ